MSKKTILTSFFFFIILSSQYGQLSLKHQLIINPLQQIYFDTKYLNGQGIAFNHSLIFDFNKMVQPILGIYALNIHDSKDCFMFIPIASAIALYNFTEDPTKCEFEFETFHNYYGLQAGANIEIESNKNFSHSIQITNRINLLRYSNRITHETSISPFVRNDNGKSKVPNNRFYSPSIAYIFAWKLQRINLIIGANIDYLKSNAWLFGLKTGVQFKKKRRI